MTRTPPSETSDADASSRRARLDARRSRRTKVTIAVVVIAIAGAVAAGAYAFNTDDPLAHAAGSTDPTTNFGSQGSLVPAVAVAESPPRALSHAHPLQLWIGGDSLAGSFGPALGDQLGATGVVKTVIDYKVSSGLWSNDIRNWDQRAADQMAMRNPDAVVFIIGTNDTPVVNEVDANSDGVPDWEATYRLEVAKMMDLLVGAHHRTVFWLGPPTLSTDSLDRGAKTIGEVMRQEALKHAPDVEYLDTYKLFSTKDGTYSRRILDENGNEILARISDGTHFTEAGAQYLARAVFGLIDARWKVTKQAELKDPIGWTFADGNGELVPGFSSAPRSRYRSGNGSSSQSSSQTTIYVPDSSSVPSQSPTTFESPTSVASTPTTTHTTTTTHTAPTTPTVPPTTAPSNSPPAT